MNAYKAWDLNTGEYYWVDETGQPLEYAPGELEDLFERQCKEFKDDDEFSNRRDHYGF